MRISLICVLVILSCISYTVASAQVIQIRQRDTVYYNDTVDLRTLTGWTENISWWARNHDPAVDEPDHIITVKHFEAFTITRDLEPGMWYQWYGKNERDPVPVFYIAARSRPAPWVRQAATPAPTVPSVTPVPVTAMTQAAPVADYLVARHDAFTYECGRPCRVWLFGSDQQLLGADTGGNFTLPSVEYYAGRYTMLLQYPDANGVYEVFTDGDHLNSTWKDVPVVDVKGHGPSVVMDRFMALVADRAHFHGKVERKDILIEEQHVDITGMDGTMEGSVMVTGRTNLAKGGSFTLVFDDDRVVLAEDRAKMSFTVNATGDSPGAYRIWRAILKVGVQDMPAGDHFIAAYPPHGEKTVVPFYVSEDFEPFEPPPVRIAYIENSPFLPTPTPVTVVKEVRVPVTVVETVVVNITPDYEVLNRMQWANLSGAIIQLVSNMVILGVVVAAIYVPYRKGMHRKILAAVRGWKKPVKEIAKKDRYVFGEEL